MKQTLIKQSQLALLLLLVIPGNKFLTLPAMLSREVGIDAYLVVASVFAVDLIALSLLLLAIKLNKRNLTLEQILSNSIGVVATKVLFGIMAVFFLMRTLTLMLSCMGLFGTALILKTNWIAYSLPIMGVGMFHLVKGFRSIARVTELIFIFVMVAFGLIIALSYNVADVSNLLPFAYSGAGEILKTGVNYCFYFSDYMFVLLLIGKIKLSKKFSLNILGAYAIGVVACLLAEILFIGLFGESAWLHTIALTKISQFNVAVSTSGRLDWINIIVWSTSLFIKTFVSMWATKECLNIIFKLPQDRLNPYMATVLTLIVIVLPIVFPIENIMYSAVIYGPVKYVFMVAQYLLPMLLPILVVVTNKKKTLLNGGINGYLQVNKWTEVR